jgi:hypothetical protein
LVKNQEKSLFFVQRFFFLFPKKGAHKKLHNYMSFSLIFHFYTAILVYSCIFLSDLVYSCLFLFCYGIFFQKQKTTIRPGNSIAKVKLLAGLLAKPGKKIEGTFFDRRNRRHYGLNIQISSKNYESFWVYSFQVVQLPF